jgi:hypothetical protein
MASHAWAKRLVFWDRQLPILYSTLRRWWRWISDLGYRFYTCLLLSGFYAGILFYFLNYGEMDKKLLWYDQVGQPLHWYEMLQATRMKQHRLCKCRHLPASIPIWQGWLLVSAQNITLPGAHSHLGTSLESVWQHHVNYPPSLRVSLTKLDFTLQPPWSLATNLSWNVTRHSSVIPCVTIL